jgi:hypothetical protein
VTKSPRGSSETLGESSTHVLGEGGNRGEPGRGLKGRAEASGGEIDASIIIVDSDPELC